jgi:hypothetical protein
MKSGHAIGTAAFLCLALPLLAGGGGPPQELCGNSGIDGVLSPSGNGIINTYFSPGGGPGSIDPATATLNLGSGSINYGDLLLVIQMQDADLNTTNNNTYGDGNPETPPTLDSATGSTAINSSGLYEYVVVFDGASPGNFGTPVADITAVPFAGKGPNGRLINTYRNEPFGANGQRTYQIVKVPQYSSAALTATPLTCERWNGSTGGVLAFDVVGALDLGPAGSTITATGRGFRGGFARRFLGGTNPPYTATDFRAVSPALVTATNAAHAQKGEGIAGTPRFPQHQITLAAEDTAVEGYPNGSLARGAPGNAGGGGTDGKPTSNGDNSGGGGGGNAGAGGRGGNSEDGLPLGGFGGAAFLDSSQDPLWGPGRVVMGGGGGAASKHDNNPTEAHGGAGGGIILIRTGSVTNSTPGTHTIAANGVAAPNSSNDGGGGGGAGGSIILIAQSGNWNDATVSARGGNGGNAGVGNNPVGPGGGGGGGVILSNTTVGAGSSTDSGTTGLTQQGTNSWGATPPSPIVGSDVPGSGANPLIPPGQIPGADSGAQCSLNAAPVNTVPGAQSTNQDTAKVFSTASLPPNAISIADPDAGGASVQVTLTVTNGTLTLSGIAGLSFTAGDGTADATMTFIGTIAAINTALNGLTYDPPTGVTSPPDITLTITTNDLGNTGTGGPQSDTDTVTIVIGNVNDPPFNTVPPGTPTTPEETVIAFTGAGNRFEIGDPDAGANPVEVTLTATNGTLTLSGTAGLTFSAGDGTADATMTFTGTIAAINTALDGLSYTPSLDFNGSATITIATNDQGNTGTGGPQSDTDSVTVDVTPTNDTPVAVADTYNVLVDTVLNVAAPGVLSNDTDADLETLTANLISNVSNGTLTLNPDGSFTYTPTAAYVGPDSFTYRATDPNNANSNTVTVSITVLTTNVAPVAVADTFTAYAFIGATIPALGVLANDTDADGPAALTAVQVTGASNGTVVLFANGSFSYAPNFGFVGTDSFTYQAFDGIFNSNIVTVTINVLIVGTNLEAGYCTSNSGSLDAPAGGSKLWIALLGASLLFLLPALFSRRGGKMMIGLALALLVPAVAAAQEELPRALALQEPVKAQQEKPPPPPTLQEEEEGPASDLLDLTRLEAPIRLGFLFFSEDFEADPEFAASILVRAPSPWLSRDLLGLTRDDFGAWLEVTVSAIDRDGVEPDLDDPDGTLVFVALGLDYTIHRDDEWLLMTHAGAQFGWFGGVDDTDDGVAALLGFTGGHQVAQGIWATLTPQVAFADAGDRIFFLQLGAHIVF